MTKKFSVKFYKGSYLDRQRQANADRAVVYVEHHFNAAGSQNANYACCVVGSNSSSTSRNMARHYVAEISRAFRVPIGGQNGLLIGGYNGRGNHNVKHTNMPAMLLEPLFVSNPESAAIVRSESGQRQLAQILAETIGHFFPEGGLVAFSVGHKYKPGRQQNDRGAAVYGGGTEAKYAEKVLTFAAELLESATAPKQSLKTLTVEPGDTLYAIARRAGIPIERIYAQNPGITPAIEPGDIITV